MFMQIEGCGRFYYCQQFNSKIHIFFRKLLKITEGLKFNGVYNTGLNECLNLQRMHRNPWKLEVLSQLRYFEPNNQISISFEGLKFRQS